MDSSSIWIILEAVVINGLLVWGSASCNNYLIRRGTPVEQIDVSSAEADRRFATLSNSSILFYVPLAAGSAALMYQVVAALARWFSSMLPAAEMSVVASRSACPVVALFFGFALTALVSGPLMRLLWPDAGGFFTAYLSARRYKSDHDRLCRIMSFPMVLIGATAFAITSNAYAQVRRDVFVNRPYFSASEVAIPYSEIKAIQVSVGRLGRGYGRDYLVRFRDGSGFDFYRQLPAGGDERRQRFAEALSKMSGVPITEYPGY